MNMKKRALILVMAGMAVLLAGCVNPDGSPNNTGSGALVGGAMGALTGAAIGGRGHAGPDALIGAAAGALAGGLIGNAADREQEARQRVLAPPAYAYVQAVPSQPTSIADVESMAKAGVSDDVIISQIRNTRTGGGGCDRPAQCGRERKGVEFHDQHAVPVGRTVADATVPGSLRSIRSQRSPCTGERLTLRSISDTKRPTHGGRLTGRSALSNLRPIPCSEGVLAPLHRSLHAGRKFLIIRRLEWSLD